MSSTVKTVWVTGASSGLGEAIADAFAEAGWQVLASARNSENLQKLVDRNSRIVAVPIDLSSDQISLDFLSQYCESLDVVIANAGTAEYVDVADIDVDMFKRVFDLNVFGAVRTIKLALPFMHSGSQLVFVSSLATYLPFTRAQAYAGSKAALDYIAASFQTDLLARGIQVSLIKPGFIKTPLTDKNTFNMPFIIDAKTAGERVFSAVIKRKRHYAFPKRMWLLLHLMRCLPASWLHKQLAEKE